MQVCFLQGCVSCNKSRDSTCMWSSCRFYFVPSVFPQLGDPSSNSYLESPLPSPAYHFPGIMKSKQPHCLSQPQICLAGRCDIKAGVPSS